MNIRLALTSAALAGILGMPLAASAQTGDASSNGQAPLPSYARGDESIHGKVQGFDGKYVLTVHDERGFTDNVQLHDGTVINPTGLRLASGMTVTIYGHTSGSHFDANEIETPYHERYGYAYGPAYGPYPYYGPGYYGYGPFYGPRIALGFRFR